MKKTKSKEKKGKAIGKGKRKKRRKGKTKTGKGKGEERGRGGKGKEVLPVADRSAQPRSGDRCPGATRALEEDRPKVTWLLSHPRVPGHRLLGPARTHPPEQLAWAWRGCGILGGPAPSSVTPPARWGEPTSLALQSKAGGRPSRARVVSPQSFPRPGRGGPG